MPAIRNLAVGLPVRGDHILVQEGVDATTGHRFCRAIGGGIEFGETAEQALRREFREELDAELSSAVLLGVIENLFEFEGRAGHEIVHVFAVTAPALDALRLDAVLEVADAGTPVRWRPRQDLRTGLPPLYPLGALELLPQEGISPPPS